MGMSEATTSTTCPKCGAAIPPEAPQGLCPKCLLQQASFPTETGAITRHGRPAPPNRDELAGAFPHLEILELIGQGGMGFVYKARQPKLDRLVALKILAQPLAEQTHFAERFTREGRTLAKLNHPNIVTIHDFGQAGPFFYLLMEYVDGVNLRQAMKAGAVNATQALAIVPRICEALQYAHNEGVLHRDIKPDNILLDTRGRVKIADFGIAKLMAEAVAENSLTGSGTSLGTPHYMAPEQIEKPNAVDHRADIYSLGVVFYEILTGELPLGRFAAPSEKPGNDPRLDEIVFQTLEKQPDRRPQSASEVKTKVETIASTPESPAVPPQPVTFKMSRCYITTPQFLQTWIGRQLRYSGKGDLRLDEQNLTFSPRGNWIVIPLSAITSLSLVDLPSWVSPAKRGLKLIAVSFTEKSIAHRILLVPNQGGFRPVWETNQHVQEWFGAIQHAVRSCTGRIPASSSDDIKPLSHERDVPLARTWLKAMAFSASIFSPMLLFGFLLVRAISYPHVDQPGPNSVPRNAAPPQRVESITSRIPTNSRPVKISFVGAGNSQFYAYATTEPAAGERFVPVIRFGDSPWGQTDAVRSTSRWIRKPEGTTYDQILSWFLPKDFATDFDLSAAELRTRIRGEKDPLDITPEGTMLFAITNAANQVIAGGIRLVKTNVAAISNPVATFRGFMVRFNASETSAEPRGLVGSGDFDLPPGYRIEPIAREAGEEIQTTHTIFEGQERFVWPHPQKTVVENLSQFHLLKGTFELKPGEPLQIFAFTNSAGLSYEALLELVPIRPSGGSSQPYEH
jgi:serine/threonine protein kinase